MANQIVWIFVLLSLINIHETSADHNKDGVRERGKVILLILDGMRGDLYGLDLPELKKVEQTGVKAEWLNGVFLTLTIPSTFSIATGLYPESHGAMHNVYFDLETQERTYVFEDTLNKTEWFNQGTAEPIWVTAINQGLKAGVIMYPGCNVPIQGVEPTRRVINAPWFWFNYPLNQAIDDAMIWLTDDDFDFMVVYSGMPDSALHEWGIGDPSTINKTYEADRNVGYLFQRLEEEGLSDITDVVIASDHGHANLSPNKTVSIYDYVDPQDIQMLVADYGPIFQLEAKEGLVDKVFQLLDGAHPAMHVFKREDFPERLHYSSNPRNLDIIGYVDPRYGVYSNFSQSEFNVHGAGHGFDNNEKVMKSIFYAKGPHFKQGYSKAPFESVNIYMLLCELLGLNPAPNNGTRANYADVLADTNSSQHIMVSGALILISTAFAMMLHA